MAVLDQAITIAAGIVGGAVGYFAGDRKMLWTTVGALAGAVIVPPLAGMALAQAQGPALPGANYDINLAPGRTIILRVKVGDTIVVKAPSGWGVPSATANIPGFLQVQSSDTTGESSTLVVEEAGQGQVQMTSGAETATLSVEVLS